MSVDEALLDRLVKTDPPGARRRASGLAERQEAVRAHLGDLLNARRGFSPAQPGYGLGELNRWAEGSERIAALQRELQETIATFEPRLAQVRVSLLPPAPASPLLRFHVSAEMASDWAAERAAVQFETSIDATMEAKVSCLS